MNALRWFLLVPVTILGMMVASLLGGLALGALGFFHFFSQTSINAASAFSASLVAIPLAVAMTPLGPTGRARWMVAWLFLALLLLMDGYAVYAYAVNVGGELTDRNALEKVLIPLFQFLGVVYGWRITTLGLPEIPPDPSFSGMPRLDEEMRRFKAAELVYRQLDHVTVPVIGMGFLAGLSGLAIRHFGGTPLIATTGRYTFFLGLAAWFTTAIMGAFDARRAERTLYDETRQRREEREKITQGEE